MFYNDFYDLLERFSIMTVDGKLTDNEALNLLMPWTTTINYQKLLMTISKR